VFGKHFVCVRDPKCGMSTNAPNQQVFRESEYLVHLTYILVKA